MARCFVLVNSLHRSTVKGRCMQAKAKLLHGSTWGCCCVVEPVGVYECLTTSACFPAHQTLCKRPRNSSHQLNAKLATICLSYVRYSLGTTLCKAAAMQVRCHESRCPMPVNCCANPDTMQLKSHSMQMHVLRNQQSMNAGEISNPFQHGPLPSLLRNQNRGLARAWIQALRNRKNSSELSLVIGRVPVLILSCVHSLAQAGHAAVNLSTGRICACRFALAVYPAVAFCTFRCAVA